MFYFLIFFVIEVSTICSQTTKSVFIYILYMVIQIMLLRRSDQLAPPVHKNLKIWKTNYTRISGYFWALEIPQNQFRINNPYHLKATLNFWKYILNKKNYSRILGYFRALLKRSISNFGLQPLSSKCTPAWPWRHDFD